jgi:predicted permease
VFIKVAAYKMEAPSWFTLTPDIHLLGFCVFLTVVVTIFFGLAPALQAVRGNPQLHLHEIGSRLSANRSRRYGLKILVVVEVAFAVMLLISAGLLLRVWQKMLAVDPGFRAENVFTFNLKLPLYEYNDIEEAALFFERYIDRLRQTPGIVAASGSNALPMGGANKFQFEAEGVRPHPADPAILMRWIFPDYFRTMKIPLMAGRDFTLKDGRTKDSAAAIVDQSFARRFWPGENPLGKRIRIRIENDGQREWAKRSGLDQWMTVVGLTRDVAHFGLDREIEPGIYIPYNMWKTSQLYILVRSNVDSSGIVGSIQSQLRKLNPDVAVFSPATMTEIVKKSTFDRQALSIAMTLFAVIALLISVAGIYGIVNYSVSSRTQEIGIRMALGATRGEIMRMIMGEGARLMIIGAAIGLVGSIASSHAVKSLLFGVAVLDVSTYLTAGVVLVAAVFAATSLPAWRAAGIEPIRALRSE